MAGYCTIADVQAHNPQRRYGPQTTPTTEDVLAYIDNRAAEINVMLLEVGISAPVSSTATVSYAWLRACNAYGAAMDAEAAMFPAGAERDESPHVAWLRKRFEKMLDDLASGRVNLQDAPRLPAASGAAGVRGLETGVSVSTAWFRRDQTDQAGTW